MPQLSGLLTQLTNARSTFERFAAFLEAQKASIRKPMCDAPQSPAPGKSDSPIPVEPNGGAGGGAGRLPPEANPIDPNDFPTSAPTPEDEPIATTLAIGEEDGGAPFPKPVDPNPNDPIATTLAIGEEDGGAPFPKPIDPNPNDPIATTLAIGEEDGGSPLPQPNTIIGSNGDDRLKGSREGDTIFTGRGNDRVNARAGDDRIVVSGTGDKVIRGGAGEDTVELKGASSDYTVESRGTATTYIGPDGSRIKVRQVENAFFNGSGETLPVGVVLSPPVAPTPPIDEPSPVDPFPIEPTPIDPPLPIDPLPSPGSFTAFFALEPNALGARTIAINGTEARLIGTNIDFTFTGVDASGLAADGPIIATGGFGTINGVETRAVPIQQSPSPFPSPTANAVLTIGSGFGGVRPVMAAFESGAVLDAVVNPRIVV